MIKKKVQVEFTKTKAKTYDEFKSNISWPLWGWSEPEVDALLQPIYQKIKPKIKGGE